jgi:hypothetical protein
MRPFFGVFAMVAVAGSNCARPLPCIGTEDAGTGARKFDCPEGTPPDGQPDANGTAVASCSVLRNEDAGVAVLQCDDGGTVTVADGSENLSGTSCTITRDADAGSTLIRCADGTSAVLPGGHGSMTPPDPADSGVDAGEVLVDPEAPGTNCATGGLVITSHNSKSYVCNGSDGGALGVDAGSDFVALVGSRVSLSGSVAAPFIGVRWNQLDGAQLSLDDPRSLTPSFVAPVPDGGPSRAVVMQLQATDGVSLQGDLVVVTLNRPPTPGLAELLPLAPGDSDQLTCGLATPAADEDGDALTYSFAWTRNGQPFTGASNLATSSTVPASETTLGDTFACVVTVSDALGASASSSPARVVIGGGLPCQWTLERSEPMTSLPAGTTLKHGLIGSQSPATVGGRTAWRQTSDWSMTFLSPAFDAGYEGAAIEADVYLPAANIYKGASLGLQVNPAIDAYSAFDNDILHGATAGFGCASYTASLEVGASQYASTSTATVCCSTGAPARNLFPDGGITSVPCTSVVDTWVTLRVELSKYLGRGLIKLNGTTLGSFATDYDDTGTRPLLSSSTNLTKNANVAFSNVRIYRGVCR